MFNNIHNKEATRPIGPIKIMVLQTDLDLDLDPHTHAGALGDETCW